MLVQKKVTAANGVELAYYVSGDPDGAPLVLLHALGEQAASWDSVLPWFSPLFRVVAIDLRGHGASDWPGQYSFELMRDDVLSVFETLGLSDVVLIGHSMGGTVAYLVAQAEPTCVSRLIVEDVPPPFPRERSVPDRPERSLPFDWLVVPAIVEQVNDPGLKWWRRLPDITAPTLLVGGGPTSHIPQEKLVEVTRHIPDCTLITIPAGHDVHASRPADFAESVLLWLGQAA